MTTGVPLNHSLALSADLAIYAARLVRSLRRRHDAPAGMRVLSVLEEHGPLGVTELSRIDGCSQPTMSTAVAQLVDGGFVSKEPHPTDARGAVVSLTEAGRTELEHFRSAYAGSIMKRLRAAGRTEAELATAVSVLRDILDE
ncbi:MarR family winged helix-turn-helix transcriptional regulator [Nocardioides sp. Kera G14]|uniref:MarR family winged helix-turn-helix transcriptional regulator n=1 Tax=Nocardioides sp. Kera G14 TaxID=2884264 RepID=UPI001D1232AB|nr:MarR family transcriptional regulator [Nocardioides sp. Kera G14]UDY22789.1 MarR family transcriptional regulator [Nocardioides sp. Kera G14]